MVSTNKTAPLALNVTEIKFEGTDGYNVNLQFSATNLKDVEMLGEIDPICIIYEKQLKDLNGDGAEEFEWYE